MRFPNEVAEELRPGRVPREFFVALRKKKITRTEFVLLVLVESLVTKDGLCCATNKELATFTRTSSTYTGIIIKRLIKKGFLIKDRADPDLRENQGWAYRTLRTPWSHVRLFSDY